MEILEKIGTRRVDELGRVVIPIDLRRDLEIKEGDSLEFFIGKSNDIIMRKYAEACTFCGSADNLVNHNGKNVCKSCIDRLHDVTSPHYSDMEY